MKLVWIKLIPWNWKNRITIASKKIARVTAALEQGLGLRLLRTDIDEVFHPLEKRTNKKQKPRWTWILWEMSDWTPLKILCTVKMASDFPESVSGTWHDKKLPTWNLPSFVSTCPAPALSVCTLAIWERPKYKSDREVDAVSFNFLTSTSITGWGTMFFPPPLLELRSTSHGGLSIK